MGNGSSNMEIEFDCDEYYPGTNLTGKVHMMFPEDTSTFESVYLELFGREEVKVVKKETHKKAGQKESVTVKTEYKTNRIIVRMKCLLLSKDQIKPGQWTVPFSLPIPRGCPASTSLKCGIEDKASIKYSLTAVANRPGMNINGKCVRDISLRAPPLVCADTNVMWAQPDTIEITHCCKGGQGSIACGATAQRPVINRGEQISVTFGLKNASKRNLNGVKATLVETTYFHTGRVGAPKRTKSTVVASALMPATQLPAGGRGLEKGDPSLKMHPHEDALEKEVHDQLVRSDASRLTLITPTDRKLQDTVNSKFVKVTHQLVIEFQTAGAFAKSPTVRFNVSVAPRRLAMDAQLAAAPAGADANQITKPPGWAPVVMPGVTCTGEAFYGESAGTEENQATQVAAEKNPYPLGSGDYFAHEVQNSSVPSELIQTLCQDPLSRSKLVTVTAANFASMLAPVNYYERIALSRMLARSIGNKFSVDHIVEFVDKVKMEPETEIACIQRLAPLACDLQQNRQRLTEKITDYEKLVCEDAINGKDAFKNEDAWM